MNKDKISAFLKSTLFIDPLSLTQRALLITTITSIAKVLQEYAGFDQSTLFLFLAITIPVVFMAIYKLDLGKHWSFWIMLSLIMLGYIIQQWPGPGNHVYVFLYLCLVMFLVLLNKKDQQIGLLNTNTRNLFVVIMLFAVLQKLITPVFMDGTINAFWLMNGGYYEPIYRFFSNWSAIVDGNHAQLNSFYNSNAIQTGEIILKNPIIGLPQWGFALSMIILISEVLVPIIFIVGKSPLIKHGAIIGFLVITFLTRQETGFLSLLCIIGMANTTAALTLIRKFYYSIFLLFQLFFLFDYGYI